MTTAKGQQKEASKKYSQSFHITYKLKAGSFAEANSKYTEAKEFAVDPKRI